MGVIEQEDRRMVKKIRDPQSPARIIEAAWRAVADMGPHGATVRRIASIADVSTGYVTHYFEDKDQILQAVLRHNNERAGARVLAAAGSAPGLAGLAAGVDALLPLDRDRRREWQVWVGFWMLASTDRRIAAGLEAGRRALHQGFVAVLQQAVDGGELPEGLDLAYQADRLQTLVAGLGYLSGVESPGRVRMIARRMVDDHLAGLMTTSLNLVGGNR
ncbi:MAG: TetR/AcrR family transcriptional regulator [Acidimicrobiales bacterium]